MLRGTGTLRNLTHARRKNMAISHPISMSQESKLDDIPVFTAAQRWKGLVYEVI